MTAYEEPMSIGNQCRVTDCVKIITQKRTALCSMHKCRWEKYKSYELPEKIHIPEGFAKHCVLHGFLADNQVEYQLCKSRQKTNSYCKQCRRAADVKSRKSNPNKHKLSAQKHLIRKKYGLSWDSYMELKESQNNICKICKKYETAINHITKEVRELSLSITATKPMLFAVFFVANATLALATLIIQSNTFFPL